MWQIDLKKFMYRSQWHKSTGNLNEEELMWQFFPEMLVCGATTLCTDLTRHHIIDHIETLWLHSTWQKL